MKRNRRVKQCVVQVTIKMDGIQTACAVVTGNYQCMNVLYDHVSTPKCSKQSFYRCSNLLQVAEIDTAVTHSWSTYVACKGFACDNRSHCGR